MGCPERWFALPHTAADRFHHHDSVVDNKSGCDGQCHERQVVEAVPEQVHRPERADNGERDRDGGREGSPEPPQEDEHHCHDEPHADREGEFDLADAGADRLGPIGQYGQVDGRRQPGPQRRHQRVDAVHRFDDVGVGLLEYEYQHRRLVVEPTRCADVLDAVDDRGDRIEPDRRSMAGGDDDGLVFVRFVHLVIDADHIGLIGRIDPPFRARSVGSAQCCPHVLKTQSHGRQGHRIDPHSHRRLFGAIDGDLRDALHLR